MSCTFDANILVYKLAQRADVKRLCGVVAATCPAYDCRSGIRGKPMVSFDRITSNPNILNGQPAIRGMRRTVRRVIEALAVYPNWDDLRREYPVAPLR